MNSSITLDAPSPLQLAQAFLRPSNTGSPSTLGFLAGAQRMQIAGPTGQIAAANARANGQIHEGLQALCLAPTPFSQGCPVHIRIENDRDVELFAQHADHVGICPTGFGRGQDMPIHR